MKTLIIGLTCLITSVFYAQSQEELEFRNRINNIVLNTVPSLIGKDYFILDAIEGHVAAISKINDNYIYYNIKLQHVATDVRTVTTKTIIYRPVFDKIFTNFTPKVGVKKYLSEYVREDYNYSIPGELYFAIYKNGVNTFDTCLPPSLDNKPIESPIEDEVLDFFYYLIVNPNQL
ncbi:hypothetical protein [Flavobacterium flavipallidum]|uniref:Uncharacterized protein n=1 Tax=Flavobacterium flavipallidum TaxID=3139140 RepID=A0ABU9HQ03_9FLAO